MVKTSSLDNLNQLNDERERDIILWKELRPKIVKIMFFKKKYLLKNKISKIPFLKSGTIELGVYLTDN